MTWGMVGASAVIPQAINKCLYDLYWDATSNSPRLATTSTLNGVPQVIGTPWELRIGSAYHYPSCDSGQWTTFDQDTNDTGSVRQLIANGNGSPLALGDATWIQPGTKSSLFDDLSDRYPTPLSPPTANTSAALDVTLLVVDQPNGLNTKGTAPIVGFAGFEDVDIGDTLTADEAARLVVAGFFQQVFDRITILPVREALARAIGSRIRRVS